MQPDPLAPQQDDPQPQPVPATEVIPPEALPVSESTPPDVAPTQEIVKLEPAPIQGAKPAKRNRPAIALGVISFLLLVAVAGLGFWAFTLNTKLTATQQELTALQGEHGQLKTDYATLTSDKEKLSNDLAQVKSDLEKANADLATAQADLKKSQDKVTDLNAKITKASKFAEILYTWFTTDEAADVFKVDSQIKDVKDTQLTSLWNKILTLPPSDEKIGDLLVYLATAVRNSLK